MRPVKGFALLLSLLFVLILTIFAFGMLLLAQDHYAAAKTLYDSENARILCESAGQYLVQQHNYVSPRFFVDPFAWTGIQMKPFDWNGYRISGNVTAPWKVASFNVFQLEAARARSVAKLELPLEQLRLEHFAFFSDAPQSLNSSTLVDGLVFVRGGLTLNKNSRFRDLVYAEVSPEHFASYKRNAPAPLQFPEIAEINTLPQGFVITSSDPRFWKGDRYELNLDDLQVAPSSTGWTLQYNHEMLGESPVLVLTFDDNVRVFQQFSEIPALNSNQQLSPLYVRSNKDIELVSSLQTLLRSHQHPLLFDAARTIRIEPQQSALRIEACLIGRGEVSLDVRTGSQPLTVAELDSWIGEITRSAFLFEQQKREELLQALHGGQKVVWFRGCVAVRGSLETTEVTQIHFESSRAIRYGMLNSFPFIRIVEGRQRWR